MEQARRIEQSGGAEQSSYDFAFDAEQRGGDPDNLRPGLCVTHNIELLERLGVGGMGTVWLAQHTGLETRVAVKFMSGAHAQDAALAERFAREAKLAARIKSPHVVQTFDYATTANGIPFIVMELLEGEDLQTHLAKTSQLSLEEASRIVVQVCKALAKAHAIGIIHRDIKPDNIFLIENDGEPFVKVLDFGIAKDQSPVPGITVSGTTMGTPSFMSPEQLFSPKDVGVRSDLWSTAVVAYRALTGRLPFEGDSFGAVCVAINGGKFPKPSSLNSEIPGALDGWFAKALSRDPADRWQTATAMANSYLSSLHEAGLLPSWAVRRTSGNTLSTFATDPGGISGGPITLNNRTPRRRVAKTILASVAAMSVVALGAMSFYVDLPFRLPALPALTALPVGDALVQLLPTDWRPKPLPQLAPEVAPPHAVAEEPAPWIVLPQPTATALPDRPRPTDEPSAPVAAQGATPAVQALRPAPPAQAAPAPQPQAPPTDLSPYEPVPAEPTSPAPELSGGEPASDPHGI